VYIKPEVEIDGYYGLPYPIPEAEVTEDDIQQLIRAEQEKNGVQESVSRPSEMGDIVTINFTGYMDGEAFEGGKGENHNLTLGSGQFIDTFENQLVGKVAGDDVKVEVTFPEGYHKAEFSGKPATFEVEILDVMTRVLPEINDEFAGNVSEFETLEAYREDLTQKIRERKENASEQNKRNYILNQLVQKAVMEVPEAMYLGRSEEMYEDFARRIEYQGLKMDMYLRYANLTPEAMRATFMKDAKKTVDARLALEAVAKKEGLSVSDEEFKAHIAKLTGMEGEALDKFLETASARRREDIIEELLIQKAMDFVVEQAVAVEGLEYEVELAEDGGEYEYEVEEEEEEENKER
jgi:trigger factor